MPVYWRLRRRALWRAVADAGARSVEAQDGHEAQSRGNLSVALLLQMPIGSEGAGIHAGPPRN